MRATLYAWLLMSALLSVNAQLLEGRIDAAAQVVQQFYAAHLSGDMAFTAANVARKSQWLSPRLSKAIAAWFALPKPADEVPSIDGDPFTGTQEYPTTFVIGAVENDGDAADVTVTFDVSGASRVVRVALKRADGEWRIVDIRYEDGVTLSQLLRDAP